MLVSPDGCLVFLADEQYGHLSLTNYVQCAFCAESHREHSLQSWFDFVTVGNVKLSIIECQRLIHLGE